MQAVKSVFITGATGQQGGAIARNLSGKGIQLKALLRNTESSKANALRSAGVEVIKGDLNDPESYKDHLRGIEGVYSVQTFVNGTTKEIKQGIQLAELAKENNVKHFLYSSVIASDLGTGVPHFESKGVIEKAIRSLDLPYTIMRPASFYENFLLPQVKGRILKGKFVSPLNRNTVQQMISAEDIGKIGAMIFMNPGKYISQTIPVANDEMSQAEIASTFSAALGTEVKYAKLPGLITRLAMGSDLSKMFSWVNKNEVRYVKDFDLFRNEFPGMTRLKDWIQPHFTG